MKNLIIRSLLFLGLGVAMFSCFDENRTIFPGPFHARFTTLSGSEGENATSPTLISVHFVGPHQGAAITVSYTFEGTAVEGVDFTINGTVGTIEIPAGESFGELSLSMINNIVQDGNKTVTFTISAVSGGFEAGQGLVGKTFELTINDDDCSPNLAGTWNAVSDVCFGDGAGNCNSAGQNTFNHVVTITRLSAGLYSFTDITGGLYLQGYVAGDQSAEVEDACGDLLINGQPDTVFGGDTFDGTGTITDIDNFTLSYSNGWGDQGDVVYTRQ